jgi:hypothetical protein
VKGEQDLSFGNILPGVPITVSKKSVDAMEFTVSGAVDAEVSMVLTLPEYMYSAGPPPPPIATMALFFFNTDCQIDTTLTGNQATPTYDDLNPHETLTYSLGPNGQLMMWLGAQVVPGLVQQSGNYSATVRLTAAYTGN